MRIGITNLFRGSAFGNSLPQVALYLSRGLLEAGHDVSFLIPTESDDWFIDCASANTIPCIKLAEGITIARFELIIEVVWFLPVDLRRQIAQKTVMFYHYPSVFYDIESSVYPLTSMKRDFNGVDALWTWDHFNITDFEYLEFISKKPVFKLPFFWNPILLESYINEAQVPAWNLAEKPQVVICESNETNTSNCTLPMVILSEIYKSDNTLKWTVVNGAELSKRDFFINNVYKNLHIGHLDISGAFMKRVRLPDLCRESNYIISHQRFRPIKYMLLDALYLGIPLIHNCAMIKELSGGQYCYTLNRIGQALDCWSKIIATPRPPLDLVRSELVSRFALASDSIHNVIDLTMTYVIPVNVCKPVLRLAFFDMWIDFQPAHNLFLEAFVKNGFDVHNDQNDPTFIIFGPFGQTHRHAKWTNIPKVFYTGENLEPVNYAVHNIGFKTAESSNYTRIPNWFLELNWYNQDASLVKNPMPLPLDLLNCTASTRTKFCIFVASNPNSVNRNTLYHVLSRYKNVDSAGQLFNNVAIIPSGPGGSGGQALKIAAYKNYRFALVCENSIGSGYVTEKLLHAKLGGCVPIYWGSSDVTLDFNKDAFLNASSYNTHEELLTAIEYINKNNTAWLTMANTPLILDIQRPLVLLGQMAKTVIAKVTKREVAEPYPLSSIKTEAGQVIVTCCNGRFVDSAIRLIKSASVPVYIWVWEIEFNDVKRLKKTGAHIIPLDTKWNPGWADFWNVLHFAWKPLILVLAYNSFPTGTQILYLDAGIEIVGNLSQIWTHISKNELFVCCMKEHKMETWCHPTFCARLALTNEELKAPQLSANIVGFISGGSAGTLLNQAMSYSCDPHIIVGHKWHRYSETCMGHRHDQSILSLMCLRHNIKPYLLEDFAGYKSHDETVSAGCVLYVHRGQWLQKPSLLKHIQSSYVVNLEHRADRLEGFWQRHSFLQGFCERLPAVYGRDLKLSKEIVRLFKNNDHKWKKSVMGCALSHYKIWTTLTSGTCLVLEDDAKLSDDFVQKWNAIADFMPADFDIIFLGGVLPPNKPALSSATEAVNRFFARVATNSVFGQNKRYFHFCTYSYIISSAGARKLCEIINKMGLYTSADHMLVNNMDRLNIYFTSPLLGGCTQDDDPIYQNADFNNFNRVDKFDSEIWNNTDAFSLEEVASLDNPLIVVYFEKGQQAQCIDSEWLREIFQHDFVWTEHSAPIAPGSKVLLYYQHTTPTSVILGYMNRNSDCKLFILHASDETCTADISIYNHSSVVGVFRNYWRPECVEPKVLHLPLGYLNGKGCGGQITLSSQRPLTWTFAGAMDRNNRRQIIDILVKKYSKNFVHMTPTWGSKEDMPANRYVGMLQDSQYVPCLDGFYNTESYRFYEALEQGAIPVVKKDKKGTYAQLLGGPLVYLESWSDDFTSDIQVDTKQKELVYWWAHFKVELSKKINQMLG